MKLNARSRGEPRSGLLQRGSQPEVAWERASQGLADWYLTMSISPWVVKIVQERSLANNQ